MTTNAIPPATLQEYLMLVDAFERDVREHESAERVEYSDVEKSWCEWIYQTYQDVACFLRPRKLRTYAVPIGLRHVRVPIVAGHATEALVNFLNPSEKLHGENGVLDSPEYTAIKSAAMSELQGLDDRDRLKPEKSRRPKFKYRTIADIAILSAFLQQKHFNRDEGEFLTSCLTQDEIADELGWDQSRVHRTMKRIFDTERPAKAYHAVFTQPETIGKFERLLRKNQKSLTRPESEQLVDEMLDKEAEQRETEYSEDQTD